MSCRSIALTLILGCGTTAASAQAFTIPPAAERLLATKYRSWKLAEVPVDIVHYFKERRPHESPNLIRGDWNNDDRTDYAVMLEHRSDPGRRLVLSLVTSGRAGNSRGGSFVERVLPANDCLMAIKKGEQDFDFETQRKFRYRTDAIFSYYWEKAGVSYVWDRGRFRVVVTSD